MSQAKKRKTSYISKKAVSRKPIAVQRKVVKKDKSKIAWQIVIGLLAALLFSFLISKISASLTGNVLAVDAMDESKGEGLTLSSDELGAIPLTDTNINSQSALYCNSQVGEPTFFGRWGLAQGSGELRLKYSLCMSSQYNKYLSGSTSIPETTYNRSYILEALGNAKEGISVFFGEINSDQTLLVKAAFFILTFLFLWHLSGKIGIEIQDNFIFHLFISLVLSILFTRWLANEEIIRFVLIPYNAVGASLATIVPWVILTYISFTSLQDEQYDIPRTLLWLVFLGYLIYFSWIYWYIVGVLSLILTVLTIFILISFPTLRSYLISKIMGEGIKKAILPIVVQQEEAATKIMEELQRTNGKISSLDKRKQDLLKQVYGKFTYRRLIATYG